MRVMLHSCEWTFDLLDTHMVAWLVTLSHWSVWCSSVGWGSPLAVDDQPLLCQMCWFVPCVCVCLCVSVAHVCACVCVRREQLSVHSLSAGIVLTPISVQLSLSTPFFLVYTHTHTHMGANTVRFWTVTSSEQASLPTENLELNPKEKTREESPLFFWLSIALSLCVCHSPAHSLKPSFSPCFSLLRLFFLLVLLLTLFLRAVNRLHCSLSQCQSSASEPQVKH